MAKISDIRINSIVTLDYGKHLGDAGKQRFAKVRVIYQLHPAEAYKAIEEGASSLVRRSRAGRYHRRNFLFGVVVDRYGAEYNGNFCAVGSKVVFDGLRIVDVARPQDEIEIQGGPAADAWELHGANPLNWIALEGNPTCPSCEGDGYHGEIRCSRCVGEGVIGSWCKLGRCRNEADWAVSEHSVSYGGVDIVDESLVCDSCLDAVFRSADDVRSEARDGDICRVDESSDIIDNGRR